MNFLCSLLTRLLKIKPDIRRVLPVFLASLLLVLLTSFIVLSDTTLHGLSGSPIGAQPMLYIFFTRLLLVSICLLLVKDATRIEREVRSAKPAQPPVQIRLSLLVLYFLAVTIVLIAYDLWLYTL